MSIYRLFLSLIQFSSKLDIVQKIDKKALYTKKNLLTSSSGVHMCKKIGSSVQKHERKTSKIKEAVQK